MKPGSTKVNVRKSPEEANSALVQSSEIFSLSLPEGNVLDLPAGSYHPCVDTGYYLMLAPLAAGHQTVHFIGANSDGSFRGEVTCHLIVGR